MLNYGCYNCHVYLKARRKQQHILQTNVVPRIAAILVFVLMAAKAAVIENQLWAYLIHCQLNPLETTPFGYKTFLDVGLTHYKRYVDPCWSLVGNETQLVQSQPMPTMNWWKFKQHSLDGQYTCYHRLVKLGHGKSGRCLWDTNLLMTSLTYGIWEIKWDTGVEQEQGWWVPFLNRHLTQGSEVDSGDAVITQGHDPWNEVWSWWFRPNPS